MFCMQRYDSACTISAVRIDLTKCAVYKQSTVHCVRYCIPQCYALLIDFQCKTALKCNICQIDGTYYYVM